MMVAGRLPILARARYELSVLLLLAIADLSVLGDVPLALRAAGATLFLFWLPGAALIHAVFAGRPSVAIPERIVLSIGASVAVAVQLLLLMFMLAIPLSLPATLTGLHGCVVVPLAIGYWRRARDAADGGVPRLRREWRTLAALALVASVGTIALLVRLHFAEFAGDERDVMYAAIDTLLGRSNGPFALIKGPAQVLLAAWYARLTGSLLEGIARLPFALCGVLAVLGLGLIAHMRVRWRWVMLAALLALFDGLLFALARIVQYQLFVLAMVHLCLFCALRAWATRHSNIATRYWLLSAFFGGSGLLGHYDAGLVALAVLYLFVRAHRDRLSQRSTWTRLASAAGVALLVDGPFYVALVSRPKSWAGIQGAYLSGRVDVGRGPFNHIQTFIVDGWLRGAVYWVPLLALIGVAIALILLRSTSKPLRLRVAALGSLLAIPLIAWQPRLLTISGVNISFIFFVLALVGLWSLLDDPVWIAVMLWAFGVHFFTAFWMANPLDHYFVALPTVVLGAVAALSEIYKALRSRPSTAWLPRWTNPLILTWLGWVACYMFLFQVIYYSAVVADHPERALGFFNFFPQSDPDAQRRYNVGWRTVAALYDSGMLRGEYDTNESLGVSHFYVLHTWDVPRPSPRYFIVAHPQKRFTDKVIPDNLAETHDLWGTVTVEGDPQIKIYQAKSGTVRPQPRILRAEDFEDAWARVASVERFERYKKIGRDDSMFYALAGTLRVRALPQDALIFDPPEARGILSQFFTGGQTYLTAPPAELDPYRRIWGIFWGVNGGQTERALAQRAYPAASEWMGNIRLVLYAVAADRPLESKQIRMGNGITLAGASPLSATLKPGDILPLRLLWQSDTSPAGDYKLFVHIADSNGKPAAQSDTVPVAGLRPTAGWHAGEQVEDRLGVWLPPGIEPGRYRVLVGLYDPVSGVRLPAAAPDGTRFANDAAPLGDLVIEKQ